MIVVVSLLRPHFANVCDTPEGAGEQAGQDPTRILIRDL